jgi:hypothetical protein
VTLLGEGGGEEGKLSLEGYQAGRLSDGGWERVPGRDGSGEKTKLVGVCPDAELAKAAAMVGSGSRGRGGDVVVCSDVDKVVDDLEEHGEQGLDSRDCQPKSCSMEETLLVLWYRFEYLAALR